MMARVIILTAKTCVVRLDVRFLHFAILNNQGVTLAPVIAKDRCRIKTQVKSLRKLPRIVT